MSLHLGAEPPVLCLTAVWQHQKTAAFGVSSAPMGTCCEHRPDLVPVSALHLYAEPPVLWLTAVGHNPKNSSFWCVQCTYGILL